MIVPRHAARGAFRLFIVAAYLSANVLFAPDFVERAWAAPSPDARSSDFWRSRALAAAAPAFNAPLSAISAVRPVAAAAAVPTGSALAGALAPLSRFVTVRSAHPRSGRPTVIVLQDVHLNPEAQKNVGAALQSLLDASPAAIVGAEAAAGPFSFTAYRRFPNAAVTRGIADALVASNRMSGVAWAGLTAARPDARVVGVDDESLYLRNLDAFRRASAARAPASAAVRDRLTALEARRNELPAPLAALYDATVAYRKGTLPVAAYLARCTEIAPAGAHPQAELLQSALALEKRLDTGAARTERNRLVEAVARTKGGLAALTDLAQEQNGKAVDALRFHERLAALARSNGIDLAPYPALTLYIRYLGLAERIDQERLFSEIRALGIDAAKHAARGPADTQLYEQLLHARLAERLVAFELTPDEWADYDAGRAGQSAAMSAALAPFEQFFVAANARDAALAANLDAEMKRTGAPVAVLVAGGFHAPGVQRYFEQRGASVALVTPRLGAVDPAQGSAYLNAFLRERAPLADLFHSERLTLADAAQLLGGRPFAGRAPDEGRNALGLLEAYAAVQDGAVSGDERSAVASALGVPAVDVRPGSDRSAVVTAGDVTVEIGPDVTPRDGRFENVLGQKKLGVAARGTWFRRNGGTFFKAALAFTAVVFITGAEGGSFLVAFGFGALFSAFVIVSGVVARSVLSRRPDNARMPVARWWEWIYTWFPVRLFVNGTGRTGIPNILIALHTPGFQVVAVNGLDNNDQGSLRLEEAAVLLENDEVFGDYGDYRVRVVSAGRAWLDETGRLHVSRNERPDGRQFAGATEAPSGRASARAFSRDRTYALRLFRKLDGKQRDWRKVWATGARPDGEARLEWLDIAVNGKVQRVLFFNGRDKRAPFFPSRALNIVGMSETSGAVLDRKKLLPFFNGSAGTAADQPRTGVQVAVLGAPPKNKSDKIPLQVLGVNHDRLLTLSDIVLSNCSCTTNGAVPLLFALATVPEWTGGLKNVLVRGHLTTTHGPTVSDQELVDVPKDTRKSGPASGGQTIPTTTGFLDVAKPVLASAGVEVGAISAISFRVPASPSEVALAVDVKGNLTVSQAVKIFLIAAGVSNPETVAALVRGMNAARARRGEPEVPLADVALTPKERSAAIRSPLKGILVLIADEVSHSSQFAQAPASTVLNLAQLSVRFDEATGETRVDLYSWYSNEWGYAMRTLESLRALTISYWRRQGIRAFLRHIFFSELAQPGTFTPGESKKEAATEKAPSSVAVGELPDFLSPAASTVRPTAALVLDPGDKVQLNQALLYLWNFLRGDRAVELRMIVGIPTNEDLFSSIARMLRRPTGYPPLPGNWSIVMSGASDVSGPNWKPHPVLRYYDSLSAANPSAEVMLVPTAAALTAGRSALPPVSHALVLARDVPADVAGLGAAVVTGPESRAYPLAVPGEGTEARRAGEPVQVMGSRALAAYHMTAALADLPSNRVSQLSVKEIVFSRGEKPILSRLRGRRVEGNIQMENLSGRSQLARALGAKGPAAGLGGETDVVNHQNGSIVQITASLETAVTADAVKEALSAYAARMAAQGYRVVALGAGEQMFSSDAFAGRPAIFINLDSVDVNDGRQVTVSAWFDDRLAGLDGLNEAARANLFAPLIDPAVDRLGPVASENVVLSFRVNEDRVTISQVIEDRSGRFSTTRTDDLTAAPVRTAAALPFLLEGISSFRITIPRGTPIAPFLAETLRNVTTSPAVDRPWAGWDATLRDLERMPDGDRWLEEVVDRQLRRWDGTPETLPNLFDQKAVMARVLPHVPVGLVAQLGRVSLQAAGGVSDWQTSTGRQVKEMQQYIQLELLRRLGTTSLTETARTEVIKLNADLTGSLVWLASTGDEAAYVGLFRAFVESERLGLPYGSDVWSGVPADVWARLKSSLESWLQTDRSNAVSSLEGGVSFVPAIGNRNFRQIVRMLFRGVSNLGQKRTEAWVFKSGGGPALAAIWKAIDVSDNADLRSLFYGVATAYAADQSHLASLLDLATEDPDLEPRVMALVSVVYQMHRWQFIDRQMPWEYLNFLLTKRAPYSLLRFKRMVSDALLSRAPIMIGLPVEGEIKDWAFTGVRPDQNRLFENIFDLDGAIFRQVSVIGIDARATRMVGARLEFWRTGDPTRAQQVLEAEAGPQTRTWRESVTAQAPNPIIVRVFEMIGALRGVPADLVPTELVADLTNDEIQAMRERLVAEFAATPDALSGDFAGKARLSNPADIDRELKLFRELSRRFGPLQESVVALRALSQSDIGINSTNLDSNIYDIERLVHREIHHGTGEHALELVESRFEYWRTGNPAAAVASAERWRPALTADWRSNPADWIARHPSAARPGIWFEICKSMFEILGNVMGVPADRVHANTLLRASPAQLEEVHRLLAEDFPNTDQNASIISQLFTREIPLYRQLRSRYDPVRLEAAIERVRQTDVWPVDVAPLLRAIERKADPVETLAALAGVRRALMEYLLGNAAAKKYEEMGDQADYAYQHGIRGVYGFRSTDPYYLAIQLDLALRPIEEDVLTKARGALPQTADDVNADSIRRSAQVLAYAIELVQSTGWATQPLRNMRDMLFSDDLFHQRMTLICGRILRIYEDLDNWSLRQRGDIIDDMSRNLTFETASRDVVTMLGLQDAADWPSARLRLKADVQANLLRSNLPLFYVKAAALHLQNVLAEARLVKRSPVDFDARETVFFPGTFFQDPDINELLSRNSEKGSNLIRMGRAALTVRTPTGSREVTVPIPPGVVYPIGMSVPAIMSRAAGDIERIQATIRDRGMADRFGDGVEVPVLYAVRSGAIFDAPGQQHTVTNWGISEENAPLIARRIGDWSAWDSLRRYYQEYAMAVYDIPRADFRRILDDYKKRVNAAQKKDLTPEQMKEVALLYKQHIIDLKGPAAIPASLEDQLRLIVDAIIRSWDNRGMTSYRESEGMMHEDGTVIIVQAKVHGDDTRSGRLSGAGAAFIGGWPWEEASGSFSERNEGSDIADGVVTPEPLSVLKTRAPALWAQINDVMRGLAEKYGTKIEVEYTIQAGEFWVLQVRSVPEEAPGVGFLPAAVSQARVLSGGYALSGRAAVGPLISIHHLRRTHVRVQDWIRGQINGRVALRLFEGNARNLVDRLREVARWLRGRGEAADARSVDIVADGVLAVANERSAQADNAERIGIIAGSDEAVPDDLPVLRFLQELSKVPIVLGFVSNQGGPGTHEQENALHLRLTAMAGTAQGPTQDHINFGPTENDVIVFQRNGAVVDRLSEGQIVSLGRSGSYKGKQFAELYKGGLPFENAAPASVNVTDSIFGDRRATTTAPRVEEFLTRFVPLTLAPVVVLSLLAPGVSWLSLAVLPVAFGVLALGVVSAVVVHAVIHVFVDGRAFFSRLPFRLGRATAYVGTYLWAAAPVLPVLLALGVVGSAFGGVLPAWPAVLGIVQSAAVAGFGLRALARVIDRHAAHNRAQLQRKAVAAYVRSAGRSDVDGAAALEFLRVQGLETLSLSEWTRSQPGLAAANPWTAYEPEIDPAAEVAHISLDDLLGAADDPVLGQTTAFRRTLQLVARLSEKNAVIVTASPRMSAAEARGRLATLLRERGIALPAANGLAGVTIDLSEKANPFAVADRFRTLLGGRRLHALPFQGASLGNWDLGDFLASQSDRAEVMIEIVRLATGDSLLMTPSLLMGIAAAAVTAAQA